MLFNSVEDVRRVADAWGLDDLQDDVIESMFDRTKDRSEHHDEIIMLTLAVGKEVQNDVRNNDFTTIEGIKAYIESKGLSDVLGSKGWQMIVDEFNAGVNVAIPVATSVNQAIYMMRRLKGEHEQYVAEIRKQVEQILGQEG